jgi:GDPmannose 4,6-dehydratase
MGHIISKVKPDEIYHLAAQSHVRVSFDIPGYTAQTDAIGTLNILESIRQNNLTRKTKFYQASTSELFGKVQTPIQNEQTPFYPRSPYGTAKLYAYWTTINYREAYNIFACNGILFNHESPRRGNSFVSKKIAETVAKMSKNENIVLKLGNLNSQRDWGYAPEYVEAMWKMLQLEKPYDLVISTGQTQSVRDFVNLAFNKMGKEIVWKGKGIDEKGFCSKSSRLLVEIDPYYFRPTEVDLLKGDSSLAKKIIGWEPKITFESLVEILMDYEISKL